MLKYDEVIQQVARETNSKIVLLVMDGLGGLALHGKTPLEAAHTPHLDALARRGALGLADPLFPGITPGSGPGHLGLFGYDPLEYQIGRGVMEALGIGVEITDDDVAIRANFATLKDGKIVDRRAGRPATERSRELVAKLQERIQRIEDVDILLYPGEEHRFVVLFRHGGLDPRVNDADPGHNDMEPLPAKAQVPEAERTARIANAFIAQVTEILKDDAPANTCLLRGFSKDPKLPSMKERFKLRPACIAVYPMYKGLAKLVGMDLLPTDHDFTIQDQIQVARDHWDAYDFFFIHVKKTDSYGEDGNFEAKKHVIEQVDRAIPDLLDLNPDVVAVTGDHSTPAIFKSHSWHPVPFLLYGKWVRVDDTTAFGETQCAHGGLGRFPAVYGLPQMMAAAEKLDKFGA